MPIIYKRILTPLFFIVVALIVLCCSSLAVGEVSGVPTVSINNGTPVPWISSLSLVDGDIVTVTSNGIIPTSYLIPPNVTLNIPAYITLGSDSLRVHGIVNHYGTIYVSSSSRPTAVAVTGIFNMYYGSVINGNNLDTQVNSIAVLDGGILNIYGGNISSTNCGVKNDSGSTVNFYSGTITAPVPIQNDSDVNYPDGNPSIDEDSGTLTVNTSIMSVISDLVSESINWITSFVSAITSNTVLLVFVLIVFTGLGVGLLRRVKSI